MYILYEFNEVVMSYLMYCYCIFCSLTPPYEGLKGDCFEIAHITDNLASWLYGNAENLSHELSRL